MGEDFDQAAPVSGPYYTFDRRGRFNEDISPNDFRLFFFFLIVRSSSVRRTNYEPIAPRPDVDPAYARPRKVSIASGVVGGGRRVQSRTLETVVRGRDASGTYNGPAAYMWGKPERVLSRSYIKGFFLNTRKKLYTFVFINTK